MNIFLNEAIKIAGSQEKLAKSCGVKQCTISRWGSGDRRITPENALKIEIATNGEVSKDQLRPDIWTPNPDSSS